eukprot:647385-Amphidinium_carterae.1
MKDAPKTRAKSAKEIFNKKLWQMGIAGVVWFKVFGLFLAWGLVLAQFTREHKHACTRAHVYHVESGIGQMFGVHNTGTCALSRAKAGVLSHAYFADPGSALWPLPPVRRWAIALSFQRSTFSLPSSSALVKELSVASFIREVRDGQLAPLPKDSQLESQRCVA